MLLSIDGHAVRCRTALLAVSLIAQLAAQTPESPTLPFRPEIPRVWRDEAVATLEVPLPDPAYAPRHATGDYYYAIPVRPL